MDALKTDFTIQFNVRYPIICAPMFLVSSVKMVVAASEAGGVGTFPALNYRPAERYLQAIREIKGLTTKPFGINIIVQKSNKYQYQQIEYALAERVPLLITSLGNPKEAIKLAHQVGTKVYCDVIGLEHAKKVADLGADGLIAVGFGAGGHAGDISPFALIPSLVKKIKLPVIAAGSISDGAGMAAAFALGACAVYMGTRFIASKEAEVEQKYKNTIAGATCEDIVNTDKVDGFPGNFIRTPELEALGLQKGLIEEILTKNKRIKRWISLSRAARSLLGASDSKASYKTVFSAGHGVGLIDEVLSIQQIMENTVKQYLDIKAQLP
jgi:nitronate monooxygenase